MLAVFGMPGSLELLIIGMLCLMAVGVPLLIIVVVMSLNRSGGGRPAKPCPKCGMLAPEHGYCPHCGTPTDMA